MLADNDEDGEVTEMAYNGGKAGPGTYQRIINLMPPHRRYIELFLGAGAVMRAKRPAPAMNLGVEIDLEVIIKHWDPIEHGYGVLQEDALEHLRTRRYGTGDLIYCDPPYMRESRTNGRDLYRHQLNDQQHGQLLDLLQEQGAGGALCMVSGYHSKLYARKLRNWHLTTFGSMTRRGMALEHLWCNFAPPVELHDYRYLGDDYRERWRIKKKVRRWQTKLNAMPKLERQALLAALQEADPAGSARTGDEKSVELKAKAAPAATFV